MSLKFYQSDLSPYAARVRILAAAKGVKLDSSAPPGGGLKSAEYLAINPLGKIPCLEVDGVAIPESETICEYLEDAFPSPTLRPVDATARARVRLLSRLGDLYLAPQMAKLFSQLNPKTRDSAVVEAAFKDLETALGHVAQHIEGPSYAFGGRISLADCTLAPLLFFIDAFLAPTFGKPSPLPLKLKEYYDGVGKDPHVEKGIGEMKAVLAERQRQQPAAAR